MINIYIPQNYSVFYIDFIIFSLAALLLIDKIIFYIFRHSDNLTKLFGSHDRHNEEFSFSTILYLFIISILPKTIQYLTH
jgi:hypothetical protein